MPSAINGFDNSQKYWFNFGFRLTSTTNCTYTDLWIELHNELDILTFTFDFYFPGIS